jgi:hypothetical protein
MKQHHILQKTPLIAAFFMQRNTIIFSKKQVKRAKR